MADGKKTNKGLIAGICAAVVAVITAVVVAIVINVAKPSIVGKYALTATIDPEGNESTTTVDLMKAFGTSYTIEFKDDKTGVLEVIVDTSYFDALVDDDDEEEEDDGYDYEDNTSTTTVFTYDGKKITGSNSSGEVEAEYEFKDGAVILNMDGEKMKFTKE